jgi:hypothetical protein
LGRKIGGRRPPAPPMAGEDLGGRSGSRHDRRGLPRAAATRAVGRWPVHRTKRMLFTQAKRSGRDRSAVAADQDVRRVPQGDAPLSAYTVRRRGCVTLRACHRVVLFRISRLVWNRAYYRLLPTIYHLPSNGPSIAAPVSDCARIANPTGLLELGYQSLAVFMRGSCAAGQERGWREKN